MARNHDKQAFGYGIYARQEFSTQSSAIDNEKLEETNLKKVPEAAQDTIYQSQGGRATAFLHHILSFFCLLVF